MLDYLMSNRLITRREAEIIAQLTANFYISEKISDIERAKLIRSIFVTLANIT